MSQRLRPDRLLEKSTYPKSMNEGYFVPDFHWFETLAPYYSPSNFGGAIKDLGFFYPLAMGLFHPLRQSHFRRFKFTMVQT